MTVRVLRSGTGRSRSIYADELYGKASAEREEGEWLTIVSDEAGWRLPLVVRPIPGTEHFDAVSPYGYPGIEFEEGADENVLEQLWRESTAALRRERVVAAFLRFPPFTPHQADAAQHFEGLEVEVVAATRSVDVDDLEACFAGLTGKSRNMVRRAMRDGLTHRVEALSGENLEAFIDIYNETMERANAGSSYFFSKEYYETLARIPEGVHVALVEDQEQTLQGASLVLNDEHVAHYHLSGAHRGYKGTSNLLLWAIFEWAHEQGASSVHLGGGVRPEDSLYKFKSSFGGEELPFQVGRAILDEDVYESLSSARLGVDYGAAAKGFFPAYRAPLLGGSSG